MAALALAATSLCAGAAEAACALHKIADLPITMRGTRPLLPAKINGAAEEFLLDSGAFFSTITPAKAAELKLSLNYLPGLRVEGVAGDADAYATRVKTFTLLDTDLHDMSFVVSSSVGGGFAGLIGQNILGVGDAEYDFKDGRVRLVKPVGCQNADLAYWAQGRPVSIVPLEFRDAHNPHTIGAVTVNGVRLRTMFDTGATTMVSRGAAARANVRIGDPGVVETGRMGGVGSASMRTWSGVFASVKIGDGEEVRNTRLTISESLPEVDMLLGADFFISHRIYVANSQRRAYVTYEGGPVFLSETKALERDAAGGPERPLDAPPDAEPPPTDADGWARRAAARLTRRDPKGALSDLDQAIALAPQNAAYRLERARIHAALHDGGARADLDQAILLNPTLTEARLSRARLELAAGAREAARADVDAAALEEPRSSDLRLDLGALYERLDDQEGALKEYDAWLATHPDDARMGQAFSGRCWARALLGRDLDAALRDGNRAVSAEPGVAAPLNARGLVRLRRGEYDRAVADYNAALMINPSLAWALWGRGVAEIKAGRADAGAADLAAARQKAPKLEDRARTFGLTP